MSGTTALAALPQPTKPSASRHCGDAKNKDETQYMAPSRFALLLVDTPSPPQVVEAHLKSFLGADFIIVFQAP